MRRFDVFFMLLSGDKIRVVFMCQNRYNLHVHHILPINHGGDHHIDNLISLCRDCHEEEHG